MSGAVAPEVVSVVGNQLTDCAVRRHTDGLIKIFLNTRGIGKRTAARLGRAVAC